MIVCWLNEYLIGCLISLNIFGASAIHVIDDMLGQPLFSPTLYLTLLELNISGQTNQPVPQPGESGLQSFLESGTNQLICYINDINLDMCTVHIVHIQHVYGDEYK